MKIIGDGEDPHKIYNKKISTHVFAAWAHLPHSKELEQDEVETICRICNRISLQNKQSGTFGEYTIHARII